jgi:hypothetical protein
VDADTQTPTPGEGFKRRRLDEPDDFADLAEYNVYQHGQLERAMQRIQQLEAEIFEGTVEQIFRDRLYASAKHHGPSTKSFVLYANDSTHLQLEMYGPLDGWNEYSRFKIQMRTLTPLATDMLEFKSLSNRIQEKMHEPHLYSSETAYHNDHGFTPFLEFTTAHHEDGGPIVQQRMKDGIRKALLAVTLPNETPPSLMSPTPTEVKLLPELLELGMKRLRKLAATV